MLKLNDDEYKAKLAYLTDLEPDYPLIPKLERGNTALNSVYLNNALDTAIAQRKVSISSAPKSKTYGSETKSTQQEIRLRHLQQSRAELSNSFYLCKTDPERAAISRRILELNKEIITIHDHIDAAHNSQKLPELVPNNDKYPVPNDPLDRYKKLHSIRTNINRMQKDVERMKLANAPERKIMEKEQKLNHLIIYKAYVERAIRSAEIVQS